jgi:sugar fermentation stimulation protein A
MRSHLTRDRGSYLLVLHLKRRRTIAVGALGRVLFRSGYHVYVGSAMNGLATRIARHKRRRKPCHWHIDYLRRGARFHCAIAIVSGARLECRLAARVRRIAQWEIPGFGCSDCRCASHLFGFGRDPLRKLTFQRLASSAGWPSA